MKEVTIKMSPNDARYLLITLRERSQYFYNGYCYALPRDKKKFEVAYTRTQRIMKELEAALGEER